MKTTTRDFGNGFALIQMENDHGLKVTVTDLGARIVDLIVPSATGDKNVVLGFDSSEGYLTQDSYIGATIGRTAGRIAHGQFSLEGQDFQVETDSKTGHTLHGGIKGFESKKFPYMIEENRDEVTVVFSAVSPDGENGYPGNVTVTTSYTLTNKNEWKIKMTGTTDKVTLFNPTNHVYFNLTGDVAKTVGEHTLWIDSDAFAELSSDSIPTGKKLETKGSGFNFTKPTKLSHTFESNDPQARLFDGIDHPFFLNKENIGSNQVLLTSPDGSIELNMATNQSSVVVFTANFGETILTMREKKLVNHGGITFETQVSPGAERYDSFGCIVLHPGETFTNDTVFTLKF